MVPLTDTSEHLAAALPVLAPHDRIAVDTEADSLHCYFEKLCLIQISVPGADLLIDPLAGMDLSLLWAAWSGKELLFHGADELQDSLRVHRVAGRRGELIEGRDRVAERAARTARDQRQRGVLRLDPLAVRHAPEQRHELSKARSLEDERLAA